MEYEELQPIEVHLRDAFTSPSARTRLLRGTLEIIGGKAYFVQHGGQGGGTLSNLAYCDLLGEIPAGSPELPAETIIKAYKL